MFFNQFKQNFKYLDNQSMKTVSAVLLVFLKLRNLPYSAVSFLP